MKRALLATTCILAACSGPHDVRVEVDNVPIGTTKLVVALALGNELAKADLVYPIADTRSSFTFVVSLPERDAWITATIAAQDDNECDLAIGAGGISNVFSGKLIDTDLPLALAPADDCGLTHTPGMLWYDALTYVLGCDVATDADCLDDETPQRKADLDAFELDATEVTVGAFNDCVHAGACDPATTYPPYSFYDDEAQTGLTWDNAGKFCAWMNKTLPTEAEWEAAMRGAEGRLYPWGSTTPDCNYGNFATSPTTSCAPSDDELLEERQFPSGYTPLGLADGGGNAAEWTQDWYAARSTLDAQTLVTGPTNGTEHVSKGGSFFDASTMMRGAARYPYLPDGTDPTDTGLPPGYNLGVRCAVTHVPQ